LTCLAPPPDDPLAPPPPIEGPCAAVPSILSKAEGKILDVGTGSGSFVPYYVSSAVTKIDALEPSSELHPALRQSFIAAGLGDKHEIIHAAADLNYLSQARKLCGDEGVYDTIVCIRVLCGIPDLEDSLVLLYGLLKPGGKLLFCEHVKNKWRTPAGGVVGRGLQIVFRALGWSFFMGNCRLDNDTVELIEKAGKWESKEVKGNFEWSAIPFEMGTFVKAR
jgi:SAM-dependent methyltransferase